MRVARPPITLPTGDTFDLVVSNSTLDHFARADDITIALREIQQVLKPGGRLILTLDNPSNPVVRLRNALPFAALNQMGLVPYFVGATLDEIVELRVARGLNLSVRMGLNSGEVVVGAIGDDLQMDYTAIGHSVGEYVAACIAGVFSLEDGLRLIARAGSRHTGRQLGAALPIGRCSASWPWRRRSTGWRRKSTTGRGSCSPTRSPRSTFPTGSRAAKSDKMAPIHYQRS